MEGVVESAIHDAVVVAAADHGGGMAVDILEVVDPTAQMKAEMRMATKTPSEWLRLLCRDWSLENESVVAATDARFLLYKSYLKGRLTSQLLCRLSIPGGADAAQGGGPTGNYYNDIDFWKILGVADEFDRAHIVANIERFCSLYNIRGGTMGDGEPPSLGPPPAYQPPAASKGDGGAAYAMIDNGNNNYFPDLTNNPAVDPASALIGLSSSSYNCSLLYPMDAGNATATAPPPAAAIGAKPSQSQAARHAQAHRSNERRRIKSETREREREAYTVRKAAEKAARGAARDERRRRKLEMRAQREEQARVTKEAALRRAAELVRSNRVPIEITRGAAAAQAAANAAVANAAVPAAKWVPFPAYAAAVAAAPDPVALPARRGRSSIVISTASDLDQIVTHSNNLWAKYNAIAKEHNQKVNWIVVAKELGIHVKVREKYARMHARAKARGFDFANWGDYRIKDYPQYFLDPLLAGSSAPPEPAKIEEPGKPEATMGGGGVPPGHLQLPPAFSHPLSSEGAPATGSIQQQQHATENPLGAEAMAGQLGSTNPLAGLASEAAAVGPVNPMVSLAAEAAGVVGGGAGFSSDQAVIAAAAAVQGGHHQLHQPPDVSEEEMTHVIPALPPPAPAPGVDNLQDLPEGGMKGVEDMPNLGSSTAV
eukprot:CAMPEP_0181118678 /NCGR_PEP_ID=MMETSP1071-20121207/23207_1 /TAXON_ID=35127 /ORGANISM="Thalassiosira sp., Strain NH16" /LENGTH=654 /DNA_ID=CAMNT_0023203195 /DNA_START=200 /DNA_END=2164 /DNA_ORIENTATION=+